MVVGGAAAALASTAVEIVLWLAFTDAFPGVLWRDTRLAAALVLGSGVLASAGVPAWSAVAVATAIHFGLSALYAGLFCALTRGLAAGPAAVAGAALGALLYVVNLHGFTIVFPWFVAARGPITLAAHLVFGASATAACRLTEGGPVR